MNVYRTFYVLLFLTILLYSCSIISSDSDEVPSGEEAQIVTDQEAYTAAFTNAGVSPQETFKFVYRFDIIASYQNNTDQSVYLTQCLKGTLPEVLPKAMTMGIVHTGENNNVTKAKLLRINGGLAETGCFSNQQPAIKVEPGQVRVDTFQVRSVLFSEEGIAQRENYSASDLDGNYRLIYGGGSCLEEGSDHVVPENCIFQDASDIPRSNAFDVRIEQ